MADGGIKKKIMFTDNNVSCLFFFYYFNENSLVARKKINSRVNCRYKGRLCFFSISLVRAPSA